MNRTAVSLFLLMGLVVGCGSRDKGATQDGGGDAKSSTASTGDFLPLQPGKDRTFEDRRFLVNKADKAVSHTSSKGLIRVESDRAFTTSNKLDPDVHVVKLYTQQKKGTALEGSGQFGDEVLPIKRVGDDVKMLLQIYPKQVWATLIKGGAKPGEKWEVTDGNLKCRCEVVGAESSGGSTGFVVEQIVSQNKLPITKRRWYFVGGAGAMRLDIFGSGRGEAAKYWIPRRQLICDDWKGDRSPLVLGEIGAK